MQVGITCLPTSTRDFYDAGATTPTTPGVVRFPTIVGRSPAAPPPQPEIRRLVTAKPNNIKVEPESTVRRLQTTANTGRTSPTSQAALRRLTTITTSASGGIKGPRNGHLAFVGFDKMLVVVWYVLVLAHDDGFD